MADQRLLDILNQSIARELAVSVQYMYQHVVIVGPHATAVGDVFHDVAIDEMKHIEKFAERLDYLGGVPTTKPDAIHVGRSMKEMLKADVAAEEDAIKLYREAIRLCSEIGDPVTRLLYEEVLSDEEEHHDTFTKLLED